MEFFDWVHDPSAWVGLATLVVLEIILGIDNLVFVAIVAGRLPEASAAKARILGMSLALLMRFALLSAMSWVMTLDQALFSIFGHGFSGRDVIMIVGGLFLLGKGTMELHERLEGRHGGGGGKGTTVFWHVIVQIVLLDAVFSLDSIVTAVGMVHHLPVMMVAVVISMGIMMVLSGPLMNFVSRHPTVVILCLGFLLMIGMTLLADGFGFPVEKTYMYAAIGFAIIVEAFNLTARRNAARMATAGDMRERTAAAILAMLGADTREEVLDGNAALIAERSSEGGVFSEDEASMVRGVLSLADRKAASVMTARSEVDRIDLSDDLEAAVDVARKTVHSRLLVCNGDLDDLVGVVTAKEILIFHMDGRLGIETIRSTASTRALLKVPDTLDVIDLVERLRSAPLQVAVVFNEHGTVEGIVTPNDLLEVIAGDFPDVDETLAIPLDEGADEWLCEGWQQLTDIERATGVVFDGVDADTLNGFVVGKLGAAPAVGDIIEYGGLRFEVMGVERLVASSIRITRVM